MSPRLITPTITLVLAVTLAACGGGDSSGNDGSSTAGASAASTAASGDAGFNTADIEFAQGMIVHHEQAIEMSEIALDPKAGASATVVELANRIKGAQGTEVDTMTGWLTAAEAPLTMTGEGRDMSSMAGMMSVEDMDALATMTGTEFDKAWLTMMIAHHEGAIEQSDTVKAGGSNAEVLALADTIIAAQRGEITEMQALLQGI